MNAWKAQRMLFCWMEHELFNIARGTSPFVSNIMMWMHTLAPVMFARDPSQKRELTSSTTESTPARTRLQRVANEVGSGDHQEGCWILFFCDALD